MAQLSSENTSLSEAFTKAFTVVDACDGGSSCTTSQAKECCCLLHHCQSLIERAALFSSNEEKDDLATSNIKYLLVPYLLAELLNSQPQGLGPLARLSQLQEALALYSQFLQRCDQYGFVHGACHDAYTAEEQGATPDPGTSRNQKIERFKRSKVLKGLVQQMRSRQKMAQDEESGTESGPVGGVGGWDEEDERQLWALQVEAAAIKAVEARPVIRQEMQLLHHAAKEQQHGADDPRGQSQQRNNADSSSRGPASDQQRSVLQQQMMNKLAGIAGQLSLSGDREAIRQQVFRPSHILPTLTVEQAGEIELREAHEREARQKELEAAKAAAQAEQRSDDEDEQELAKQRAWDDFTDDNPRGWGNSKLRPCA